MSIAEPTHLSEAEYLTFERTAEGKHEYRRGEVVALAGGSPAHNWITLNIGAELRTRLRGRDCAPFVSDQRVRFSAAGLYAYPDAVVVCGGARFDERYGDTLLNPTVIFEVLSPSTEAYDRGDKFRAYRTLETLREYVLVSQTGPRIEQFTRQENGLWLLREVESLDATLELAALDCALPLREVYERVAFA